MTQPRSVRTAAAFTLVLSTLTLAASSSSAAMFITSWRLSELFLYWDGVGRLFGETLLAIGLLAAAVATVTGLKKARRTITVTACLSILWCLFVVAVLSYFLITRDENIYWGFGFVPAFYYPIAYGLYQLGAGVNDAVTSSILFAIYTCWLLSMVWLLATVNLGEGRQWLDEAEAARRARVDTED